MQHPWAAQAILELYKGATGLSSNPKSTALSQVGCAWPWPQNHDVRRSLVISITRDLKFVFGLGLL